MLERSQSTEEERFLNLPHDVIALIVSFIPVRCCTQRRLHALALVSRSWYTAVVARLYHSPGIYDSNFGKFFGTILRSKNSGSRRDGLEEFNRRLDLRCVYMSRTRTRAIAKLLRRMNGRLEEYIAPSKFSCDTPWFKVLSTHRIDSFPAPLFSLF